MTNPMKQFGELTGFLKNSGINFSQILSLLTGKPTKKQVSDVLRPVMIRYAPYVGEAVRFKEKQYGRQCVFIISSQEDEKGNTVEAMTFATVADDGGFEPQETIPLYEIVDYIINSGTESGEAETAQLETAQLESTARSVPKVATNPATA